MRQFTQMQLCDAKHYAMGGGQALHVHRLTLGGHRLFARYPEAAHLFDQDEERLLRTARKLGVRVLVVEKRGTPSQHIDLCAGPLARAKHQAARLEEQIAFDCT